VHHGEIFKFQNYFVTKATGFHHKSGSLFQPWRMQAPLLKRY